MAGFYLSKTHLLDEAVVTVMFVFALLFFLLSIRTVSAFVFVARRFPLTFVFERPEMVRSLVPRASTGRVRLYRLNYQHNPAINHTPFISIIFPLDKVSSRVSAANTSKPLSFLK